jgi:type II secretory pathway pseudopilin PulG
MMVVMVILIVVMALVAPIIGNARNAAKRTNTRQLLSNLSQASQQFEIDNRTLPGYFSPVEMGSMENISRGFSEANNVLLDLAGGRIEVTGGPPADAIQVGPTAGSTAYVRVGLIGAPTQTKGVVNKGYFTPDPKYFKLQDGAHKVAIAMHLDLPDLVDGFGQPILAWRQDLDPTSGAPFGIKTSNAARASFYWASNAAFLQSQKLGMKEQNQDDSLNGSMLSSMLYDAQIPGTLAGLLGNPAFPDRTINPGDPPVPAAARGKLVFHSAGTDGVFLGKKDRGGVLATRAGGGLHQANTVDYKTGQDPLDDFDDVISVAGN